MKVDIEFTISEMPLSKAIAFLQKKKWSHARARYWIEIGGVLQEEILEAIIPQVIAHPPYNDKKKIVKLYSLDIDPINITNTRKRKIGNWFDIGNLFMLFGMIVLKYVFINWCGWKSNPNQDICVDIILDLLGLIGAEKTDLDGLDSIIEQNIRSGNLKQCVG